MKDIYSKNHISGFPELLPKPQAAFNKIVDTINDVFSSYGYISIDTSSFERIETITSKGDINKEIYGVFRLLEPGDDNNRFALRFDHTVPLARYVAKNFDSLAFPFKRKTIGKVWRGERPAFGRFREFYQADIDVVGVDRLSFHFDAEIASIMYDVFKKLDVGPFTIQLNNRKIVQGFLESLEIENDKHFDVMMTLDKLAKIGDEGVRELLSKRTELNEAVINQCIDFCKIKAKTTNIESILNDLPSNRVLDQGKKEMTEIAKRLNSIPIEYLDIDFSIMRGLDYYTGTVYECILKQAPEAGSVCSGGRYDDLASRFIKKDMPGVGVSIGITRLFHVLNEKNLLKPPAGETDALIVLLEENHVSNALTLASNLRTKGMKIEVYPEPVKLMKQIKYAEKRDIPYLIFIEDKGYSIKNMSTRKQDSISDMTSIINHIKKKGRS